MHDYSLHPIIGLKVATIELLPLWTLFWRCSEKKRYPKISKISKKRITKLSLFLWRYNVQSRIFDFNKNRLSEKCFWRVFWNLETCQGKVYNEVIYYSLLKQHYYSESTRLWKNNIIYFSVNTSKNCWFERSSTKTSWIELSHHRFVVRVWPPVMRRRELSTAVTRIMCMESGWNW